MVKLFSRLPMWALYAFAGFLYFLAYYVVRHRQHVIREQLAKIFPALSEAEREAIHRQFLRNFCDVMVEVLKSVSMSPAQMSSHIRILNLQAARDYLDAGQSVMFVTSHLCNWEWLLQGVTLQLGYPGGCRLQAAARCVGGALDAQGALALRCAADSRQGAAR